MKFTCTRCENNPELKKVWGCEGVIGLQPIHREKEHGKLYRYFVCPHKYVEGSVISFDVLRQYHTELNAPLPPLNKVSYRFLLALRYYQGKVSEYQHELSKEQ